MELERTFLYFFNKNSLESDFNYFKLEQFKKLVELGLIDPL